MYCGLCGKVAERAIIHPESGVPCCPDCAPTEPTERPAYQSPPPPPPVAAAARTREEGSGFASAALALGAVGITTSFFVVGGLLGLIGAGLGVVSLIFRKSNRGMAWTGLGLCVAAVAIGSGFGYAFYEALDEDDVQSMKEALTGANGSAASSSEDSEGTAVTWVGSPAPDLAVTTLDGEEFRLADLKGRRVIVDVWATWCEPCTREIPHFQRLHEETASEDLVILGLSFEDETVIREFVAENEMDYAVAAGNSEEAPAPFNAPPAIPTTYFIDKNGVISAVEIGYRDYESLLALVSAEEGYGGGDEDAEQETLQSSDSVAQSYTALIHASLRADRRALRRLLADGQQLEERDDDGMTALMHASARGLDGNVEMLLDLGARLEARDAKQQTALIHAASQGRIAVLERLLARGANRLAKDAYGRTAADWARDMQHLDALAVLVQDTTE